jgi:CRP-like cAMP-binding protein
MQFKNILKENFGFSTQEIELTENFFEFSNYKAREFFLTEGAVAHKLGIVNEGLFRTYFYDKNGNEITTSFHEPGSLLLSIESFNFQSKAKENMCAITDCTILSISYEKWHKLNTLVPKWGIVCKTAGDYISMRLQSRARELQTLSAAERYNSFCKKHPYVIQNAPVGYIASYLGVDIATLSRIRKKV